MAKITAFSTLAFSKDTLDVALKHIASFGFKKVELAHMEFYCRHYPLESVNPEHVRELLGYYGITPVSINFFTGKGKATNGVFDEVYMHKLNIKSQAAEYIARVKKLLDYAKLTGIPTVLIPGGARSEAPDRDEEMKAAAEVLNRLADYAKSFRVRIAVEMPHVYTLYNNIERAEQMLSYFKSDNLGVLLCATHWHVLGYDPDEYIKLLGRKLWHVHMRDAAGADTGNFKTKLEITPGKGEVDFKRLAGALDKSGYEGEIVLEPEYQVYESVDEVDGEIRFGINYLKKLGLKFDEGI
jgi:sugar phosphate isomerase/epimerase